MDIRWRCSGDAARDERGAVAVVVALFLLILIAMMAFVVDFGRVFAAQAQLQNAVDAAALAAAPEVCDSTADPAQTAVDYAQLNGVVVVKADVEVTPGVTATVRVPATDTMDMVFGQLIGTPTTYIGTVAAASVTCGVVISVFAQNELEFNGTGTDGYGVYVGGELIYASSGGQDSTFGQIYFDENGDVVIDEGVIGPRIPYQTLTTTSFYALLQAANPTSLPAPLPAAATTPYTPPSFTIDPRDCVRDSGRNPDPYVYASKAALFAALAVSGGVVNCTGDLTGSLAIGASDTIRASIFVNGNISMTNPTLSSRLIYSRDGLIDIDQTVSPTTVVFAELGNAVVNEAASKPTQLCTVIGQDVNYKGGPAYAGCANPILDEGNIPTANLTE